VSKRARFLSIRILSCVTAACFTTTSIPAFVTPAIPQNHPHALSVPHALPPAGDLVYQIIRQQEKMFRGWLKEQFIHGLFDAIQPGLDQCLTAAGNNDYVAALEALDALADSLVQTGRFSDGTVQMVRSDSRTVQGKIISRIVLESANVISGQLMKLRNLIQANAPPDENSDFILARDGLFQQLANYLEQEEYGAVYQVLQEIGFYIPPQIYPQYEKVLKNIGLVVRLRLENGSVEYGMAAARSEMVRGIIKGQINTGKTEDFLALPDDSIFPPEPGDVIVFAEDLQHMPVEQQGAIAILAADNLVSEEKQREAERIAQEEVHFVVAVGMGGLSRRGFIYANFKKWVKEVLGWIRLGDFRLAQIAHQVKQFKKATLIIVESYFTKHYVDEVMGDPRADLFPFNGGIRRIRSTLTPLFNMNDASVFEPYSPEGLGVASNGDMVFQPLLSGAIGDLIEEARKNGENPDNIILGTFNMNVPTSVPSADMVGDFHRRRKELREAEEAVPFVAFQMVPMIGEKGGMLGWVQYKLGRPLLQIIEMFLLSDKAKKKLDDQIKDGSNPYIAFNTNAALIAVHDLVKFFFYGTDVREEDLTSEALKNEETFKKVLREFNAKMVKAGNEEELQGMDVRNHVPVLLEAKDNPQDKTKPKIGQVSTILAWLGTLVSYDYSPALYYMFPRDIDQGFSENWPMRVERSTYDEYKKRSHGASAIPEGRLFGDNLQKTTRLYSITGLLSLLPDRGTIEHFDRPMAISELLYLYTVETQRDTESQTKAERELPIKIVIGANVSTSEKRTYHLPAKSQFYHLTHTLWKKLLHQERYGEVRVRKVNKQYVVEIETYRVDPIDPNKEQGVRQQLGDFSRISQWVMEFLLKEGLLDEPAMDQISEILREDDFERFYSLLITYLPGEHKNADSVPAERLANEIRIVYTVTLAARFSNSKGVRRISAYALNPHEHLSDSKARERFYEDHPEADFTQIFLAGIDMKEVRGKIIEVFKNHEIVATEDAGGFLHDDVEHLIDPERRLSIDMIEVVKQGGGRLTSEEIENLLEDLNAIAYPRTNKRTKPADAILAAI